MGIFHRHAPLIGALGPGLVRLHTAGGVEKFAIRGGFIHVKKDVVTLLVTDAVKRSDVDRAQLDAEYAAVLEALRHPRSDVEYAELLVQRKWCEVRLALVAEHPHIIPR
jgi:F-type H+-transporting ATPase subunit epsilon